MHNGLAIKGLRTTRSWWSRANYCKTCTHAFEVILFSLERSFEEIKLMKSLYSFKLINQGSYFLLGMGAGGVGCGGGGGVLVKMIFRPRLISFAPYSL